MLSGLPVILEYGILGLALASVVLLAALGKMQATDAVSIITAITGYGVGAAKGTSLANSVISGKLLPTQNQGGQ